MTRLVNLGGVWAAVSTSQDAAPPRPATPAPAPASATPSQAAERPQLQAGTPAAPLASQ